MRFDQPKSLTAAQQFLNLRANPISCGTGHLHAGRLDWEFETSPSPLSRTYAMRLTFQQGDVPKIYVDKPDLTMLAEGRLIPHLYEQRPARLCLYLPRLYEWQSWMRLDRTIVPWSALWLFYFEDWLATGEWKGGGEHPPERPISPTRRRMMAAQS